jgi:hypothetical protein
MAPAFDVRRTSHRRCRQDFSERGPRRRLAGAKHLEYRNAEGVYPAREWRNGRLFWSRGLQSRGLHSFERANGQLAWWFGGELPDTRLAFDWGGVKGSRVLCGASEKRKVQWHFGWHFCITPQSRSGSQPRRCLRATRGMITVYGNLRPEAEPTYGERDHGVPGRGLGRDNQVFE